MILIVNPKGHQNCLICCEEINRSTKAGCLVYLDNSKNVIPVLVLSFCERKSMRPDWPAIYAIVMADSIAVHTLKTYTTYSTSCKLRTAQCTKYDI